MLKKIKNRWDITSNFQLLKIFVVFGITGSTAAWISEPLCDFMGINILNLNIFIYEMQNSFENIHHVPYDVVLKMRRNFANIKGAIKVSPNTNFYKNHLK